MKKIVSTILTSALALSLCACSSSRLDDLERRVSALEEKTGQTTTQATEDTFTTTTQNSFDNNTEETTTAVTGGIYDLSNMSADEIVSEVFYYVDNRPQQGDSYEAIQARFKIAPADTFDYDYGITALFNTQYSTDIFYQVSDTSINQDQLIFVNYSNAQKAMNGSTVDVRDDAIGVGVCFGIVDYSKAEEVFNAIGNYLNSSSLFTNVYINRDTGTQWTINFDIVTENGSYGGDTYVRMNQAQNGYIFGIGIQ